MKDNYHHYDDDDDQLHHVTIIYLFIFCILFSVFQSIYTMIAYIWIIFSFMLNIHLRFLYQFLY